MLVFGAGLFAWSLSDDLSRVIADLPAATQKLRLADRWTRLAHIYHREIWQSAFLKDRSLKGYTFAVLRVSALAPERCPPADAASIEARVDRLFARWQTPESTCRRCTSRRTTEPSP